MLEKPLFSSSEFEERKHNLLAINTDIDLSIIFNRPDLFYYSSIGLDGMLLVDEDVIRYVNRNTEFARELTDMEIRSMTSFRVFKELSRERRVKSIGLELDILPYKTVQYIQKAFNNADIIDISQNLRQIRSIKSAKEQEYMAKACKQTDDSFEYIRDKIYPGITELELSADIEYFLRREGHPGWIQVRKFDHNFTASTFVMAGESTSYLNSYFGPVSGHGLCRNHMNGASRRKIKEGDAVLIDTTGVVEGYTADETRTFFVGKVDEKYLQAYEIAKLVQNRINKILIEGNTTDAVYNEIVDLVLETDFSDNFMGIGDDKVKFIGHGVGLELDEFPIITSGIQDTLKSGQIVAVEPKFIFKNQGGVGIEDTWIIGKNQAKRITEFPWD